MKVVCYGITAGAGLSQEQKKVPACLRRRPLTQIPGFLKPGHLWSMSQNYKGGDSRA